MDNSNTINTGKKKTKSENVGGKEQYRVVINDEANKAIEEIAKNVNDGFNAGAVTKSDIANYVFLNLQKYILDADIKNLRALHFDDKQVLGALLRGENDLPSDLKKVIRAHYGICDKDKKRSSKMSIVSLEEPDKFALDKQTDTSIKSSRDSMD